MSGSGDSWKRFLFVDLLHLHGFTNKREQRKLVHVCMPYNLGLPLYTTCFLRIRFCGIKNCAAQLLFKC